jgi:hypothetical protein
MHMRIYSWSVALGIVGLSAAAAVGCSSSTTVNGGTGDDASTDDGSTTTPEPDSGTDTGTSTPVPDGSTVVTEGGDGGLVCDIPAGSDACDTCALTSCCDAENTCQTVEAANDAGSTDCIDIFSCVQDCLAPPVDSGVDAGSIDDCTTTCSAGHTTQGMTDFAALSTCLVTNCATQCQ